MTQRLPIPGQDDGIWGNVLNGYLSVSHNADGTLIPNAITNAGGYTKPSPGIPKSDLTSSVQTSLTSADNAIQFGSAAGGDLTGSTYPNPVVAKIQGTTIASPPGGTTQFLRGDGTWTVPAGTTPAATASTLGTVELNTDLSGTATAPQVVSTHLAAALPVNQGGTGQVTQQATLNALAGTQSAGKYLRSDGTNTTLSTIQAADVPTLNQNTTGNAATVTTNANLTGDVTSIGNATTLVGTANVKSVIETVRLDQMTAPTADVSLNSHKIIGLANGSVATDAAAFGQVAPLISLKSTWWYPLDGGGGNRTMTYQLLWVFPFDCQKQITMTTIGCNVKTAGTAGSTIRLGIFSGDGAGLPGALLLDAGTVAGDSTGVKTVVISQAASPDRLWLGAVWQGTNSSAPVLQAYAHAAPYLGWSSFYQFPSVVGYQYSGISGALSSLTGVTPNVENNNVPAVQFQVQ